MAATHEPAPQAGREHDSAAADAARRQDSSVAPQEPGQRSADSSGHSSLTVGPMKSLNSMHQIRHDLVASKLDAVHVIVGNEACDLDSAVSCLLMFHIASKVADEVNGKERGRTLYIPLLNTSRAALDSKLEVLWLLEKTLAIDKSFLTCKDDIDWAEIKRNGIEILFTLVDHNYSDELKDIGRIVEIVDHHQPQNPHWLASQAGQLRLTLDPAVGSCTTLVAERLFYIYAEHHVSDEILMLIYGTVLLDTICLSEKAKRYTRRDVYLLKKLDALLGAKRPVRDKFYQQLVEVKNSNRDLSFAGLMRRDLKVFKDRHGARVAIASLFGMGAREALGLAAQLDMNAFMADNDYQALVIMGLIADPAASDSISRDLVLVARRRPLFELLCAAFEAPASKLELTAMSGRNLGPRPEPDDEPEPAANVPACDTRIWLQGNVTSSRKVLAPLVLKVLHDNADA